MGDGILASIVIKVVNVSFYNFIYFHPQAVENLPDSRFTSSLDLQKKVWQFTEELIDGKEYVRNSSSML